MARREPAKRRSPSLPSRPRVLVVCGSRRTEAAYLKGLRDSADNRAVDLRIVNRPRAPLQVVQYAIRYRSDAGSDFDETWCVFDIDQFDIDQFDIEGAVSLARDEGICLAISNPCFELWLLLHHCDCGAHLPGYDAVRVRLKKYVPAYDKATLEFGDFQAGVEDAIGRAKALDPSGEEHGRNRRRVCGGSSRRSWSRDEHDHPAVW